MPSLLENPLRATDFERPTNSYFLSALQAGAVIGSKDYFAGGIFVKADSIGGVKQYLGNWVNVTNDYVGLRFKIAGKTHYGWARLTVQITSRSVIKATLTGYAYETIPNKPIIAGKTKGPACNRVRGGRNCYHTHSRNNHAGPTRARITRTIDMETGRLSELCAVSSLSIFALDPKIPGELNALVNARYHTALAAIVLVFLACFVCGAAAGGLLGYAFAGWIAQNFQRQLRVRSTTLDSFSAAPLQFGSPCVVLVPFQMRLL